KRRSVQLLHLLFQSVRSMISANHFYRAVGQTCNTSVDVFLAPKWRAHLKVGIERPQPFIGQREMVRTNFRGYADAAPFGATNQVDASRARNVHHVDAPARGAG